MNVADFTYLLEKPDAVNLEASHSLESVLEEYPFFQAARAVYLKGLKNLDSFKYNEALKVTAAYTTDRSVLFDFITSKSFVQNDIAKNIADQKAILGDINVEAEEVVHVSHANLGTQKEAEAILDPALFEKRETDLSIEDRNQEDDLKLGKPLEFDKNEVHSFSEWLKLSQLQPIVREEKAQENTSITEKEQKFALIDKFIEENPKISPSRETISSINLAQQNLADKSELMTETLARIYLEQKKYKKAIQSYKILSLKYPEKSGFFADQIRAIKKLQQNN